MKKMIFMLLLAIAVCVTGCGNEDEKTPQNPQTTENDKDNGTTETEDTDQETTELEQDTDTEQDVDTEQDTETDQNTETEVNPPANDDNSERLNDYMASIKEQSDEIKASLENDVLSQHDMNLKSEELYKLWDDALNYIWKELKNTLPEAEFTNLLSEQRIWVEDKEAAVKEAGKDLEGGSLYPLVVNSEAAALTEKRVYELYEMLK